MQAAADDRQWGKLAAFSTRDRRPHLPKRPHDSPHRATPNGLVPRQADEEILASEKPSQQTDGGSRVPAVDRPFRLCKPPQALAVNMESIHRLLDIDPHSLKRAHRVQTIFPA